MEAELIYIGLAAAFGIFMAWGIGANDVANAMATSVGSKALTSSNPDMIETPLMQSPRRRHHTDATPRS